MAVCLTKGVHATPERGAGVVESPGKKLGGCLTPG